MHTCAIHDYRYVNKNSRKGSKPVVVRKQHSRNDFHAVLVFQGADCRKYKTQYRLQFAHQPHQQGRQHYIHIQCVGAMPRGKPAAQPRSSRYPTPWYGPQFGCCAFAFCVGLVWSCVLACLFWASCLGLFWFYSDSGAV